MSVATARSRPKSLADWCQLPLPTHGHVRRCGGSTRILAPVRWSLWSHGPGVFRTDWPPSSVCATNDVAHRIATRRSGIATMPHHTPEAGRPQFPTGWDYANAATTSKRPPAGESAHILTKPADTWRNTSPQPAAATDRQRRRAPRSGLSANSKSRLASRWRSTPPSSTQEVADDAVGQQPAPIGEHETLPFADQQAVVDGNESALMLGLVKQLGVQTLTQPDPQQHVLGVTARGVQLLEAGDRQPRLTENLGICVRVLDIPPPRVADEAVGTRAGTPPLSAVPVAQIVPALPAGPTPVRHLIPVQAGLRQLLVQQLIATCEHVIVRGGQVAAPDPARQRGAV